MSATPPVVPALPGPACPARNGLGVVALVVAIAAAVVQAPAGFIALLVQTGGGSLAASTIATAIPVGVLSIAALILGIIAVRRRRLSPASPSAAIGIAVFLLVGQVAGLVATLVVFAL